MKKIILFALLVFGCSLPMLAQSQNDYAAVLQKCIDLKALQNYYPQQSNGSPAQLYVMQHGVSFPETTNVSKGGKKVAFVSKTNIKENKVNAYFLFWTFNLTPNKATVAYSYYYNKQTAPEGAMVVNLELEKTGNTWEIKKSTAEKR